MEDLKAWFGLAQLATHLDSKIDMAHALIDEILLDRVAFRVLHDAHIAVGCASGC